MPEAKKMREFKIRMAEPDIATLDQLAASEGVSRAELIRNRVLATQAAGSLTPNGFNCLVTDTQRFMRGMIDRRQIETIVSFVFNRLAKGDSAS